MLVRFQCSLHYYAVPELSGVSVTCVIMQRSGGGFYAGSTVYWDSAHDGKRASPTVMCSCTNSSLFRILSIIGSATYQYESKNLFAIVNVFALSVWKYIEHGKNLCLLRVFPLCTCLIGEIIERFQFEFKTKRWKALLNFLSFGRRADNDNVACSRSKHVDKVLVQHAMQIIECRSLQRNLARFLHNSGNWLLPV